MTYGPARLATGLAALAASALVATAADAQEPLCEGYGPQTPRDIALRDGANARRWTPAPDAAELNLCNIHGHVQAEHKGPGFAVHAGIGERGGYRCNDTDSLTEAQLAPAEGAFEGVVPGDTLEVHWVYSSCDVDPGAGLESCLSDKCANPTLRVEAQVFLVANDPEALDFESFGHAGNVVDGLAQPLALPEGTGEPVVFLGSTTGPKYTESACSALQVTWSVRPQCATLDINSLHRWAERGNVFEETAAQGVRGLVTAPELLSPME